MALTDMFSSKGRGSSLLPKGDGASSRYKEINFAMIPKCEKTAIRLNYSSISKAFLQRRVCFSGSMEDLLSVIYFEYVNTFADSLLLTLTIPNSYI